MAIFSLLLSILPFLLVIAAGRLVRRIGDPETAHRRFFLLMSWTGIGLAAWIVLSSVQTLWPYASFYNAVLAPVAAGAIAMAVLNLSVWRDLRPMQRSLIGVATLILITGIAARFLFGALTDNPRLADLVLIGLSALLTAAGLVMAWTVGRRSPLAVGLIALAYLAGANLFELGALSFDYSEDLSTGSETAVLAAYLALPGLAIPAMAFLTADGLAALPPGQPSRRGRKAGSLALAALLLASLVYTFVWLWIWDGIDDGIRGYFMLILSGQAAAAGALAIVLTVPGKRGWAGLAFLPVVGAAVYGGIIGIGTRFHPYEITEARAGRIAAAVERYRLEAGAYPADLEALEPGQLWRVPRPMIFADQGWCYQSGQDFYRLGAVYREDWSSPIFEIRVYASAGEIPAGGWVCDERFEEVVDQYGFVFNPPEPQPLAPSVVPVPRTVVEPALRGTQFSVGSWSPDGAHLVFGLTQYYGDLGEEMEIDLHFLAAATGEICRAARPTWQAGLGSNGLRDHFAWLPDGRGLYVSDAGEMVILTPCRDAVEDLAGRYPAVFDRIFDAGLVSGRVLLGDAETFWMMDGATLAAAPIAGLDLAPDDVDWALYTWSPDGTRLALSVLTGPETGFLYIVDAVAYAVETALPVEGASEAALPIAEWLSDDELLLHGSGMRILDLRSDHPGQTDLVRDVFLLDVNFPNAFSSLDFLPDLSGEGYVVGVRIDHPRNAGVFLYSSATGEVSVFRHDVASIFFFPDGRRLRFTKWEDDPSFSSEFELVWMARPGESQRLTVEGHTPRAYPFLFTAYLPTAAQLIFYSSQGISLVSLPDGETLAFWDLAGAGDFFEVFPTPGEEALVVVGDGGGVYYIPILR